ncbi:MAG: hypothetical protein RLZZ306_2896 [Bacteroidota bacterium]
MKKDTIIFQQERDFGDKINASFTFVSQNFKTLILSVLYFAGPLSLIGGIAQGIVQSNNLAFVAAGATKPRGTNPGEIFANSFGDSFTHLFTLNYLIAIVFLILATVTVAITVYSFIIEYKEDDNSVTIENVWARMKSIFLPVLGCYGIVFLITILIVLAFVGIIGAFVSGVGGIFGGFIALIIGFVGIAVVMYFGVMYILSPAIVAYEGIGALEALSRAKFLIKDKWWSTFGLIMIITIINSFVAMIFGAPAMIVTFMKVLKVGGDISGNLPLILTTMLSTVGQVLVSSLTYVAISFQYFNLVEKREGNGLKMLIESIGQKKLDLNEDGEY